MAIRKKGNRNFSGSGGEQRLAAEQRRLAAEQRRLAEDSGGWWRRTAGCATDREAKALIPVVRV
jgi:hypothetical protein